MRITLIDLFARGMLHRDWLAVRAQLSRLREPAHQLRAARLLRAAPFVTMLLVSLVFVSAAMASAPREAAEWSVGWLVATILIGVAQSAGLWASVNQAKISASNWTIDALGHTIVRLVAVLVGVGVAVSQFDEQSVPASPAWSLVFFVALFYSISWEGSLIAAIAWRLNLGVLAWPFLPLLAFVRAGLELFRSSRRRKLVVLAWLLGAPGLVVAITWLLQVRAAEAYLTPFFGLVGLAGFAFLAIILKRVYTDYQRLRLVPSGTVLDAPELRDLLVGIQTERGLLRLIELIRRHELTCAHDSVRVFDDIVIAAERWRRRFAALPWWRKVIQSIFIEIWWTPYGGMVSERAVDEIARLVAERTETVAPRPMDPAAVGG